MAYRHRDINAEDVFLGSYPRSGSTWLQFLLYEVLTGASAEFVDVNQGIPYVGSHSLAPSLLPDAGRIIKTHELCLPYYSRAIYLVRDPRDVLLSEFKYMKMTNLYRKDFRNFFYDFLQGKIHAFGNWQDHVSSWLDGLSDKPNRILFVRYLELKEDPAQQLTHLLRWLNIEADDRRIQEAIDHNTIDQMKRKENKARETHFRWFKQGYHFVNTGEVGGWKDLIDNADQEILADQFEPVLRRIDLLHSGNTPARSEPPEIP